jgi:hypothetical protein
MMPGWPAFIGGHQRPAEVVSPSSRAALQKPLLAKVEGGKGMPRNEQPGAGGEKGHR